MLFGLGKRTKSGTMPEVIDLVERYLRKRHLDPEAQLVDAAHGIGWWLNQGSAVIYLFVLDEPRGPVLSINAPVVHFPAANREGFFQYLLELNRDLSTCCLSAFQEVVLVTAQRPTAALDPEELQFIVDSVAALADRLDDELPRKFHAMPYKEDPHCVSR